MLVKPRLQSTDRVIGDAHKMFSRLVRVQTAGHISNKTICIKIQFSINQHQKKMQAQKGLTKSALLIWTKSDLSDKVFNRYFTIWPDLVLGISDLVRFTPIWSDLVRFGPIQW